jgi:hypothetical protein
MQSLYEYGEAIPCIGLCFLMAIVFGLLLWNNLPSYEKKKPHDQDDDKEHKAE